MSDPLSDLFHDCCRDGVALRSDEEWRTFVRGMLEHGFVDKSQILDLETVWTRATAGARAFGRSRAVALEFPRFSDILARHSRSGRHARMARPDSAHFTATVWTLMPAYCSALP